LEDVNSLTLSSETLSGDFSPNSLEESPRGLDSWRLIRLDNLDVLRTRPPLEVLHYLNPMVWRPLFPRWRTPTLLCHCRRKKLRRGHRLGLPEGFNISQIRISGLSLRKRRKHLQRNPSLIQNHQQPNSDLRRRYQEFTEKKELKQFFNGQPYNSPFQGYINFLQHTNSPFESNPNVTSLKIFVHNLLKKLSELTERQLQYINNKYKKSNNNNL